MERRTLDPSGCWDLACYLAAQARGSERAITTAQLTALAAPASTPELLAAGSVTAEGLQQGETSSLRQRTGLQVQPASIDFTGPQKRLQECFQGEACPYCLDSLVNEDGRICTPLYVLPCGHAFCAGCVSDQWLTVCMVCRTPVASDPRRNRLAEYYYKMGIRLGQVLGCTTCVVMGGIMYVYYL